MKHVYYYIIWYKFDLDARGGLERGRISGVIRSVRWLCFFYTQIPLVEVYLVHVLSEQYIFYGDPFGLVDHSFELVDHSLE